MPHSHLSFSVFACILALSLLSGAGCFFGDDKDSPSESSGDTTPPEVVDHYPPVGATNVERNVLIWIEFSESMDGESVTDNMIIAPSFGYLSSWDDNVLDITPTNLLNASTIYTVTIDEKSEDSNGNQLGAIYIFSFMTGTGGDLTPPTVLSTVPDIDESGVPPLQPIEVRFSEPMNLTSVTNSIEIDPYTEILDIEWMGATMRVYHDILPQDSLITVIIGTLAADLAGNNLASPYTWTFRTVLDEVRPWLLNADPANGATEVATSLNTVVLTFSEPMNPEFEIPASDIDARLEQAMGEMENPWNEELTMVTLDLSNKLLPGCTYWTRFGSGVTDLAGNTIDPNPTGYEFTTLGDLSYFPVQNNYIWYYFHSEDVDVARRIENYVGGTGLFDLVTEAEISPDVWQTYEIWHLARNTAEILHMGRDEYEEGVYQATITWDEPIVYMKLPIGDYAGTSWNFETFALMPLANGMDSLHIEGTVEIEDFPANLLADYDPLDGTFKGCCVHHLYGDLEFYLEGSLVGTESFHEITWLSPGAGPVRIVNDNGPSDRDTLYVYDWEL
jgi:hypothetical protein